jgi:hypothetical protein
MTNKYDFAAFKQSINLTQYAASIGYSLDRRKSTKSSVVMRHSNGDKVIVSRRGRNWVYFSVHDDKDNGTIVSFIERRTGKRMAEIGQELSAWLGGGVILPQAGTYAPEVTEHQPDRARVKAVFGKARVCNAHPYLINIIKTDKALVIGEVAIDTISYHAIFAKPDTAYAAVSGGMGSQQYPIVMQLVRKMQNLETIILATDNDEGGDSIAGKLEAYLKEQGFTGEIIRRSPESRGDDWNEVLKMLPF